MWRVLNIWRVIAIVFILWLVGLLVVLGPLTPNPPCDDPSLSRKLDSRIRLLEKQLSAAKAEHVHVLDLLKQSSDYLKDGKEKPSAHLQSALNAYLSGGNPRMNQDAPSAESSSIPNNMAEVSRRRVEEQVDEMWMYLRASFEKLEQSMQSKEGDVAKDALDALHAIHSKAADHYRATKADLDKLMKDTNPGEWREKEAASLANLVQRRLRFLQNPESCDKSRKLVCSLTKACGFGCQVHHVTYCLLMAYATERTLILQSSKWKYDSKGWENMFMPLSDTCTNQHGIPAAWNGGNEKEDVISLPIIDNISPRPVHLPLAVPSDLYPRLSRFHGNPPAWWMGQLLSYVMRFQPDTEAFLKRAGESLGFHNHSPIVGVHIRRTDKVGTEAQYHSVEEYMKWVDDWFLREEVRLGSVIPRRVFVASDDPRVILETREKFPLYEVLGDPKVAQSAAVSSRYSSESLQGVIIDIHFLSHCSFLVCTFSSQLCRVAYELMQTMHADASSYFKSLDDIYYYGGQNGHNRRVVMDHIPQSTNEIQLIKGELVGMAGNHWDGYSAGKLHGHTKNGLFPTYKTVDVVSVVEFPTYPEVPDQDDKPNQT